MEGVPLRRIEESEDIYLTPAQVRDLADAMTQVDPRYRALVLAGCYAGPRIGCPRIGELVALRGTDLDLLRRTLSVTRP